MKISFPCAALIEQKGKPAVSVWLAADTRSTFTLEEAGRYVDGFAAVRDGKISHEALLVQMVSALDTKHRAMHMSSEEQRAAHGYDCSMRCIATFDGTVVYEMAGKLYSCTYSVSGGSIVLADDDAEVVAQFVPTLSALSEETRITEARDLIGEGCITGGLLQEGRLDKPSGVIYGTVMINAKSANGAHGRLYAPKALRQIAEMSEGLPAYANHVPKEMAFRPRDVREMIGRFRNVRFEESKQRVTGDLHVLKHHRDWVMSLAEEMGDIAGISLVSRGAMRVQDGVEIIEEIVGVRSGDLVSDPATTKGLFEHKEQGGVAGAPPTSPTPRGDTRMELTVEKILEHLRANPTSAGMVKTALFAEELKIAADGKLAAEKALAESKDASAKEVADLKAKLQTTDTALAEAKVKIDAYEAKDKVAAKRTKLQEALNGSDLVKKYKDVGVSDVFVESLMSVEESAWSNLIDDRVKLLDGAKGQAPRSSGKDAPLAEGRDGDAPIPDGAHQRMLRAIK